MSKDNTRAMFGLEAVMHTGTYIYMVIQEIMVIQGQLKSGGYFYL